MKLNRCVPWLRRAALQSSWMRKHLLPMRALLPSMRLAYALMCAIRIDAQGQVMGTFALASTRRSTFEQAEVRFMQTICNFLALAWECQRASAQLRRNHGTFFSDDRQQPVWAVCGGCRLSPGANQPGRAKGVRGHHPFTGA
jgi:transcriptional regulator with GAF, ATPase, and Fis domain